MFGVRARVFIGGRVLGPDFAIRATWITDRHGSARSTPPAPRSTRPPPPPPTPHSPPPPPAPPPGPPAPPPRSPAPAAPPPPPHPPLDNPGHGETFADLGASPPANSAAFKIHRSTGQRSGSAAAAAAPRCRKQPGTTGTNSPHAN